MVGPIIQNLASKINAFLAAQGRPALVVDDIGRKNNNNGNAFPENSFILTLASIEEEATLKNNYPTQNIAGTIVEQKSALYLNLFILISANFATYQEALNNIDFILQYFQVNTKIKIVTENPVVEYNLICNLHNINFENLYNLWSIFGSHYQPSVLYKLKIVMIQEAMPTSGPAIVNIEEKENLQ
jgi:hypothetical protein